MRLSFVKSLEDNAAALTPVQLDWWSPERFGLDAVDVKSGGQYFAAACACAQEIQQPLVLAQILNAMWGKQLGPVEQGFIGAMAAKALAGTFPKEIPFSHVASFIRSDNVAYQRFRSLEARSAVAFVLARKEKNSAVIGYFIWQILSDAGEPWIGGATSRIAGAAINGAKH